MKVVTVKIARSTTKPPRGEGSLAAPANAS